MTMITPSYLGETIEYSSLHACRSTLEDPTAFTLYGCVVNEDIGTLVATEKTVPFCVVKPLHCSLVLCHVPNSLCALSSCVDSNRHLSTHCDAKVAAGVFSQDVSAL